MWGPTQGMSPPARVLSSILAFPSIPCRGVGMKSELPHAGWDQSPTGKPFSCVHKKKG